MYLFTTNRSKILDRTGTTEMGLKSPGPTGVFVLATGRMRATRHCSGIVEELSDWLKRRAIQPEHFGARRRRNQAGKRSRPSAVGFKPSRIKKVFRFTENTRVRRRGCIEYRWQVGPTQCLCKPRHTNSLSPPQ